jgi:hypothetical protein
MSNPNAWLDDETERHFDSCASEREGGGDIFTNFTNVLRRSNPLLPPVITGPLKTLSTRLLAHWRSVPKDKVKFHELKSELLAAFCLHLENLAIFQASRFEPSRSILDGLQFYSSPPSRSSGDHPFPNVRRSERLEVAECLYLLTVILSTAEDEPLVYAMPEGAVRYIPYYDVPQYLTAPKRGNAASLASAAMFFRLDTRQELHQRVFRFESAAEALAWDPNLAQESVAAPEGVSTQRNVTVQASTSQSIRQPLNDEAGYRRIAKVAGNACSIHGGVSYLVLKLMAVLKEYQTVGAFPTTALLKPN